MLSQWALSLTTVNTSPSMRLHVHCFLIRSQSTNHQGCLKRMHAGATRSQRSQLDLVPSRHQVGSLPHRLVVSPHSSRLLRWSSASQRPRNSKQTPSDRQTRNFPSKVFLISVSSQDSSISSIIWREISIILVESNFYCASNSTLCDLCGNEIIYWSSSAAYWNQKMSSIDRQDCDNSPQGGFHQKKPRLSTELDQEGWHQKTMIESKPNWLDSAVCVRIETADELAAIHR